MCFAGGEGGNNVAQRLHTCCLFEFISTHTQTDNSREKANHAVELTERDWLMDLASSMVSPDAPVLSALSLPAKSTSVNFPVVDTFDFKFVAYPKPAVDSKG